MDSLRVLAVRADKPIAEPGEVVRVDALVVGARDLRFAWATCTNPGSGEVSACAAKVGPFQRAAVTQEIASFDVRVSELGTVGVVFAACAGELVPEPRAPGAPIGCAGPKEGFVWGMKRVLVLPGARNENPAIARVTFDGRRWDEGFELTLDACQEEEPARCPEPTKHVVTVELAEGAAEPYLDRVEDVVTSFFATQGSLEAEVVRADRVAENAFVPNRVDPARPIELWFVARDDRGGTSFTKRSARVR